MKIRWDIICFVVFVAALLWVLISTFPTETSHRFHTGDIVEIRLDGQRGVVKWVYRYSDAYRVSIPLKQGGYFENEFREHELRLSVQP